MNFSCLFAVETQNIFERIGCKMALKFNVHFSTLLSTMKFENDFGTIDRLHFVIDAMVTLTFICL